MKAGDLAFVGKQYITYGQKPAIGAPSVKLETGMVKVIFGAEGAEDAMADNVVDDGSLALK